MGQDGVAGSNPQISLQCLNGATAPQPVVQGWQGLAKFAETVRREFWELLGAVVMAPADPDNQARLEAFCDANELERDTVFGAIQACDFLLGNATALNLEPDGLRQDLTALSGGQTAVATEFQDRYQAAKPLLRNRLMEATLSDHGKLLTGLDWRVDNVTASDRGAQLNATVVYLTMRYRDGENQDRVTFQLTPEALKQLKAFTDRFGS
ncbi:MAG: COMM domain-containing protein [bacterium]